MNAVRSWSKNKLGKVDLWEVRSNQACVQWLWEEGENSQSVTALHNLTCNSPCLYSDLAMLGHSFREKGRKII